MTAVGPLNVETKPILIESPAEAGLAKARAAAPASQNAVLISRSLLIFYPAVKTKDASWNALFGSRAPSVEVIHLVREISDQPQARTARPALEPSADAPTIMHHNSRQARKARIIVPVRINQSRDVNGRRMQGHGVGQIGDSERFLDRWIDRRGLDRNA
jgi:hypothetical protein